MSESFVAISGAKFPEGSEPGRAVSRLCTRAGRDQPAFHDSLQKAVLQEPVPMNSTQFARLKNTTPVFLKLPKGVQRCRQFLVRCRHCSPYGQLHVYDAAPLQVYYDARKQVQHAAPTHVNVEQDTRRHQHTCAPIRTDLDCSGSSFARQLLIIRRTQQTPNRGKSYAQTMPKQPKMGLTGPRRTSPSRGLNYCK